MESVSKDVDEVLKQIKDGKLSAKDGFSYIKNDRKVCRYKKYLVEKELSKTNRIESCKTILVFSKDDSFMKKGQVWDTKTIIRVTSGTKYCYLDDRHFVIHPEKESDYEKVFEHLKKEKVEIDCIVNLFLLECEPEKALDYGVYSFYYMLKYLSKCNIGSVKQIYGVYRNHFDADASCISGFCKSAGKAVPGISFCTLEVDTLSEEKIDLVLQNEIAYGFLQADREIVYCNEKRYERKMKEYQPEQIETIDFRQNGVYLITGGMGKIGNLIMEELSHTYHAKLIVCQRKPYSKACEETFHRLEIPLSDVLYCECNIEDKESMEEVKQKAHSKFGEINGVFYCAGIVTETMVTKEDREVFSNVISTKAKGIKVLDEVLKEEKLDFFYACSSISSVIGDFGQCSYAIANRNLEVYMQYREDLRNQGKRFGRSFSVSWPLWKDGGMHVFQGGEELYLKTSGMEYLENEEGLFLLKQSFKDITTNQIIFYGNKEKIEAMVNMESEIKGKRKGTKKNYTKEAIIQIVKDNAAAILESSPEELDENENISEYGFDSISLRELAESINSKFEIEIAPTLFYAYTTIESIVEYLLSEYKELTYQEEECEDEREEEAAVKAEVKSDEKNDDIAIIGMDGMLPESGNLKEFFNHILNGDDCTKEIPSDRWDYCDFYTEGNSAEDKVNAKWGGFIPDMKKFDPRFFGISPREAGYMDPQQRIFLKTTWNAIEDAGYRVSELSGKNIGVFVGMQFSDYQELLRLSSDMDPQMETGNAHTMLSNRVSYMFNFHGPSENVDTACSSSLVAVHRAIQSIRNRESDMAIAGGVSLIISPLSYLATGKLGILSKTGSGKTFDQDADGYVKGEGVVSIFLKRLSDAERDHDHIYAVIKGSAVNHGGHANTLTSPNPNAQADLLCKAWKDANVEPDTLSFIETHGTGTKLGDPIEIDGLKMAFAKSNALGKEGTCGLGSVKPNIGHLEPASGITGLVKVALAMKAMKIPGTIHIKKLNEYLKLNHSPFYVVDKTRKWEKLQIGETMVPRRAGVSSFGFGGTNAHVVLEEYDGSKEIESKTDKTNVVVFSAKSRESLQSYIKKMLAWLKENTCKEAENEEIYNKFKQKIFHLVAKVLFVNDDNLETDLSLQEYEMDEIAWNQLKDSIEEAYAITCSEMDLYQSSIQNMVYRLWNSNKEQIISNSLSDSLLNYNAATVLEETKAVDWESFCYTLQLGREEMKERAAFVVSDFLDLIHKMTDYLSNSEKKNWYAGTAEHSSDYQGQRTDYDEIAKAWCRGEKVDWAQLYEKVPFKMSLPTYAFIEQEYWIERTIDWQSFFAWRSGKKMIAAEKNTAPNMLYKRILVEDGVFTRGKRQLDGCYIILSNQCLEERFYESIRENSQTKWILIGKNQPENGLRYIEADLADYNQCNRIAQNLLNEYQHITGIIDLTALENRSNQIESVPFGIIAILQQVIKADRNALSVLQVTRGLEAGQDGKPSLAGATLQGFMEEIRYEYASVSSMSIDVDFQIHDVLAIADLLELLHKETHELCIRNNKIYKPSIVEIDKPANETVSFSSDKVYVVAGGTSGIGLQMMVYMMKKGAKRFLALCHHELPERSKWAHVIETTRNQKEKNKLRMLDKLYQAGAEIQISTVRLSDETGISSLLEEVRSKGRKIGGFIQAASYDFQENPLFIHKNYDDFDKVMEPKVYGTQVIAKCMESDTLDFFLVFSSVASVLPHRSVGMSHYVAANRFMDRFIAYKRACGHLEYKCVNWVLWGETGNACKEETVQGMKKYGMLPMTNAEGVQCFEQILGMDEQQVIAGHLEKRLAGIQSERRIDAAINVAAAPEKEGNKKGSKETLMEKLRSIIANTLKLDVNEIQNQEEFGMYGVDSIIMQVLVHKMESELNLSLNPAIIIENETLEKLTDAIFEDSEYRDMVLEETQEAAQEEEIQREEIQKEVTYSPIAIQNHKTSDKIAIIGISCDFPGGKGKEAYWNVLKEGKDCVTEIPQARWDKQKYYDPDGGSLKTNSKWGGFIDDAELFDAAYFKIKEPDAMEMDPLQRKFLESTAETIADAGYSERELWGHRIGVFGSARVSNFAYKLKNYDKNTIVGTAQNFVTAQVAQYFNFTGPNMIIDTACSSSLVAIHQACSSILQGECEMAIAGGVEILLDEKPYLILGAMKGLSPTGTCHTFDRRADGFVPGEGVGTVLLKRLEDAIQDGDNIYGVVEGSFTNNDGNTMGITTPNPTIQNDLLLNTYERACIDPSKISYMEAHGTGTMIGDPIELKSLTNVFRQYTDKKRFCAIGSVKANIGHLLLASGVAGVIKILLALQHKQLPKSLHCEQPNKRFNFEESPFYIVDHLSDWIPLFGDIRMAGISSFGLGGTNAHIVLRELTADETQRYEQKRFPREIVFHRKAYPWNGSNQKTEQAKENSVKSILRLKKLD